jgi:uncharacterized membrane protein YcaP (DUF421 family)
MDLVLRSLAGFSFILLLTRIIGRRELSSMEPFDLILLVVVGDLVQQGITQNDESVTGVIVVMSTIGLLTALVAFVNFRFPRVRPFLEGRPVVLVENGRVIDRNIRRERVTVGEIESEARQQQIGSVADVRLAVLETNGRISFLPKEQGDSGS